MIGTLLVRTSGVLCNDDVRYFEVELWVTTLYYGNSEDVWGYAMFKPWLGSVGGRPPRLTLCPVITGLKLTTHHLGSWQPRFARRMCFADLDKATGSWLGLHIDWSALCYCAVLEKVQLAPIKCSMSMLSTDGRLFLTSYIPLTIFW